MTVNKLNNLNTRDEFSPPGFIAEMFNLAKSILSLDKGDENAVGLLKYKGASVPKKRRAPVEAAAISPPPMHITQFNRNRTLGKVQMTQFIQNKF
jgi:hypothetical protein